MMDHRCLYGHRTPASFAFAIDSGSCPVCGAPLVSVVGYQIARKLASTVPLDPVDAFNTVRTLELEYELVPRTQTDDEVEVSMAEIEIDDSEVESTNTEVVPVEKKKKKKSEKAVAAPTAVPVEAPAQVVEVVEPAVDLPLETVAPPPVASEAGVEDSLSDIEKDFFATGDEVVVA
jgi:hypothetical protein